MTKFGTHGMRSTICADYRTAEDRSTYRRWARGCTIAYSLAIVALLAVGLLSRETQDSQIAKQSQKVGVGTMARF